MATSCASTDFVGHSASSSRVRSSSSRRQPLYVSAYPLVGLLVLLLMAVTATAAAGEPPAIQSLPPLNQEQSSLSGTVPLDAYEELLERVAALEARETKPEPTPTQSYFDLSKEKWKVKLGGHVQLDYITWPNR
ncbi:MAG: hypothetical protein AB7I48_13435 [Planctomycetaceae bacterium]